MKQKSQKEEQGQKKGLVPYLREKHKKVIFALTLMAQSVLYPSTKIHAATSAEAAWDNVIDFVVPWIARIGGAVILFGALEFGFAFKNEDAEGKTRGLRIVGSGGIIWGICAVYKTFLYNG